MAGMYEKTFGIYNDKLYGDAYKGFELGDKYLNLREKLLNAIIIKRNAMERESMEASAYAEGAKRLAGYQKELEKMKADLAKLTTESEVHDLYQTYWDLKGRYLNDKKAQNAAFTAQIDAMENVFIQKTKALENNTQQGIEQVKNLYTNFKQAYESKSEYELVDFLSGDWDSGDGTTLTDLEDHFRNMFSVYDAIQYSISNIQAVKKSENLYQVNYEVTIIGQIYTVGITRKEKSSVTEEVIFENGNPKINRTLNGRFWYRE